MTETERDFLRLIREAVFANPFDDRRAAIDRQALAVVGQGGDGEVLSRLVAEVWRTLEALARRDGGNPSDGEGRDLLFCAHLFHVFHRFCDRYDALIRRQVAAGERCCSVPFAEEALQALRQAGCSEQEALHFFALFFQMRRAFYFISRIVGRSPCMQRLRKALWNNVFSADIALYNRYLWNRMEDFSTLILGETGVGKGMAAAAIGRSGFIPFDGAQGTFTESFVSAFTGVNLSQYAQELIESELFGHRKGAFTGAMENHQGLLQRCSPCGAIFLDEIGDVALPVQIKLLKVLQERSFYPVGSHRAERFAGRVIAATNQDLERLRQEGRFRDDFYYRLCSDQIEIPPLRRRLAEEPGELQELLEVVLRRIVGPEEDSGELALRMGEDIRLRQPPGYGWPGNIRELEQCVRQYLLRREYRWQVEDGRSPTPAQRFFDDIAEGSLSAVQLQSGYCRLLYERLGSFEAVARVVGLDRRTVKKYVAGGV